MKRKPLTHAARLLCALALSLSLAPAAFATDPSEPTQPSPCYPTAVTRSEDGTEIRKMYDLGPEDDPGGIPRSDFEQDGYHYTLTDLLKQELPANESRQHTETVSMNSKSKDMGAVLALLPQTKEFITEDGLSGVLTLKLDTVKVEVAGYGSSTKTVTATRTYPGLANQDTQYIPKTIQDGGNSMTLQAVDWQTEGDGHFTAMASYSGSATSSYVKGYTVTADYAGTVSRINLNKIRYVAIFEGTALDSTPEDISDPNTPADQTDSTGQEAQTGEKNSVLPVVAVVAAVLLGGGAFYFIKRRRAYDMKKLTMLLSLLCLTAALTVPTSALEYDIAAPGGPEYGKPTSVEPVATADRGERPNVDVSKNAALVPPAFGSPTAYTLNTGTPLTPNLAPGYMLGDGAVINGSSSTTIVPPDDDAFPNGGTGFGWTDVTGDLYYSGGWLGTLKIPAIDLSVKVYQGTDSSTLKKGAGHFPDTSIWNGNCCIAGHNRGVRDDFGDLHTLDPGDTITWTTKLGTRTYEVISVTKVLETDTSGVAATSDNRLTLYTCVRDQRDYRWMVQAIER